MLEQLETRRLFAAVGGNSDGLLFVTGDDVAETIELRVVTTRPDGQPGIGVQVYYNGEAGMLSALKYIRRIEINAGGGDDTVIIDSLLRGAFINGGEGNDTLIGGNGNDTVLGGAGDDAINGRGGSDRIAGQDGNDCIKGMAGFDALDGGAGNDVLLGGLSADRLSGGNGADLLLGEGGTDALYGGNDFSTDTCYGGAGIDKFYEQPHEGRAFTLHFDCQNNEPLSVLA